MPIKKYINFIAITLFWIGLLFYPPLSNLALLVFLIKMWSQNSFAARWKGFRKSNFLQLFWLWYLLVILAGLYSANTHFYLSDLLLKLPFLVLPLVFLDEDLYSNKVFAYSLESLNFLVFIVGLASFLNFEIHKEELVEQILRAKAIPIVTGINHIYFSVIIAFSVLSNAVLYYRHIEGFKMRNINLAITLLNMVFLHSIAARTGLLGFYFAIFILLIMWALKRRSFVVPTIVFVLVAALFTGLVRYVDPLQSRYQKSMEDINVYRNGGNINHYSISMRIEYWEKSFKVFLNHPILGTGKADVKQDMKTIFEEEQSVLIKSNRKGPHNQYLQMLAGHGIVGFIVFTTILLIGIWMAVKKRDLIYVFFLSLMLFSFFFESFLERQVGLYFFTFLMIYLYNYAARQSSFESKGYNEQQ